MALAHLNFEGFDGHMLSIAPHDLALHNKTIGSLSYNVLHLILAAQDPDAVNHNVIF
jgi:hypothetical protein